MSARTQRDIGSPVALLITLAAIAASAALTLTFPGAVAQVADDPERALAFLGLALVLQLFSVEVYGRGSIGVSAIAFLAAAASVGPEAAMLIGLAGALVQFVRRRGILHRALFDASNFVLSTGVAGAVFAAGATAGEGPAVQILAATVAGIAWQVTNTGLLCVAMSLSEGLPVAAVWEERFRWARWHFLAFGPLAAACSIAYERVGVVGLAAFALPPLLAILSVREYLGRTRAAVEEVRRANEELTEANAALAARNDDLRELFEFAGGLAARTHDRAALVSYAEESLARLAGATATVSDDDLELGTVLFSGGVPVGSVGLEDGAPPDGDRWARLSDTLLPQLATALESAYLVEEVRKTHLATIAALSRSMEAKDYDTGGHTERVAQFALALAKRLGFSAHELDALEIGALLHDIGKIGIPERILHKPGPLDEDEWAIMREHPVISERILAEADLPPVVLQIARSSHERIDGTGYPDGLRGEEIPLPARIVLVADAFDALTSDRPYRRGRSAQAAMDELRAQSGSQCCPTVIAALEAIWREEPHLLGGSHLRAVEAGAA